MDDPALSTLFLPFEDGTLVLPETGTLFLRARAGSAFARAHRGRIACEQSFRPAADALAAEGFAVAPPSGAGTDDDGGHALVLLLPPRQRDEAKALFAEAVRRTAPGGHVVAAVTNAEGARTAEADLGALSPVGGSLSKHKARVFWTRIGDGGGPDAERLAAFAALDAPRPVLPGFLSRPGLFAHDRVDAGSALLGANLPADLAGRGADLGAGWGYLAAEVLARCPGVTALDLYEAEARALELARSNLAGKGGAALGFHWSDATRGLPAANLDFIVMNPPFHERREDRTDLGQAFIRTAAAALRPGGRLFMVANRHLPYEATLAECFAGYETVADASGYKVIAAIAKPAAKPKPAPQKGARRDKGREPGRGKDRDGGREANRDGRSGGGRR